MKSKKVKNFIYEGLGFPIKLHDVQMVKFDNEWHPKIDVRKVADKAIKDLVLQKERLTGNQIKFIRSYFSMSLREFAAKVVHESHTAVSKWEKSGNKATKMDQNIEVVLRLYIHEQVGLKTNEQESRFYKKYQAIKQIFESPSSGARAA